MLINVLSQPLLQFPPQILVEDFARSSSPRSHPHSAILQLKATFLRTSLRGMNGSRARCLTSRYYAV